MFVCPACKIENRETAKYCRRCGLARQEPDFNEGAVNSNKAVPKKGKAKQASGLSEQEAASAKVATKAKSQSERQAGEQKSAGAEKTPAPEEASPEELSQLMAAGSSQCPSCWSAVRASDRFCCWCGQEQPARLLPYFKVCLECSTHLPEKANFCFSCGTDVSHQSRRKVSVPYELFQEEDSELFPRFEV